MSSPATQYWDASQMISSSVQLLQNMRALAGWSAGSYLGPRGNLKLDSLSPFNGPSVPVVKLLAANARVKLALLSGSHCLHDASQCTAYGFTAGVWLRLTPNASATAFASAVVSLVSSQSLSVTYSVSGGLNVSVQFATGRPVWTLTGVQVPLSRFAHLAVSWSPPAGLNVYVNGTLARSLQQGDPFSRLLTPNSTSELILGDANANARPVIIELLNFAYWDVYFSSSIISNAMGLDNDKASLIGSASDFWTFYGLYSALQPLVPVGYGKGLSKATDRTGRGFGVVTDAATNSYIQLASAAQVLSGGALGVGARGLLQPDLCAAGLSFSFYVKLSARLQGYLFSSGGELTGKTGFAVSIQSTQLTVLASSNSTLVTASYQLDSSYWGKWLKLQVYWQPPGQLTSVQLGGKTPYSQACPLFAFQARKCRHAANYIT